MKAIHAVNAVLWHPGLGKHETHKQTNEQTGKRLLYTCGRSRTSGNNAPDNIILYSVILHGADNRIQCPSGLREQAAHEY